MKCKTCGSTEVGAYKEIRSLIAEMGITKEDIQKEIKATIDSYVRSAMSQDIHKYVEASIKDEVRRTLGTGYGRTPLQDIIKKSIQDIVDEEIRKTYKISIDIKKDDIDEQK